MNIICEISVCFYSNATQRGRDRTTNKKNQQIYDWVNELFVIFHKQNWFESITIYLIK